MLSGFRFEWRITTLTLVVLPILLSLGFWQLQRAEEKKVIFDEFSERRSLTPVTLEKVSINDELAFKPVQVTGEFDREHFMLLDNRVYQSRVGYDLLAPFKHIGENGEVINVLINIGWLAAPNRREQLPDIPDLPVGQITLDLEVYVPPGEAFLLAEQKYSDQWPQVIQTVDITALASRLGLGLFPYQLRVTDETSIALPIDWVAINVTPQKHIAYAVQWFAMAAALLIWFIFASREKHGSKKS